MKRNTKTCNKCNNDYSLSCFNRHYEKCNGEINYWKKVKLGSIVVDNETFCKFCRKQCKNANSQRNHSRLCKSNPNKQKTFLETNKEDSRIKNKKYKNHYIKAKELGLPKPEISENTRQKMREVLSKTITPEIIKKRALKTSETITKKIQKGEWHTFKNCPNYEYKGYILNGSWELKYAEYLDKNNIKWDRNDESFPYMYNNTIHKYTPDFHLLETDEYVEIKGYKTEKDEAKWSQFPKKLIVLEKQDLLDLKINIK